jgi:putative intracellular protease/amidase
VNSHEYDAIFYVGGHGPVLDLAEYPINIKLASDVCSIHVFIYLFEDYPLTDLHQFWQSGKVVSAVCHGTAALAGATDSNGTSIFQGRRFTGFSNAEEEKVGKVNEIPFLLEDRLSKIPGSKYEKASELWGVSRIKRVFLSWILELTLSS